MNRETPIDAECGERIGEAFVAVSEAVADISDALERGAQAARVNAVGGDLVAGEPV